MNKHKFVKYLRSPKDLDRGALLELESVVEEYPYFQSARTLLAKAGKNLKSKKTKLYVSSAAVYATDRALLKRYINDELIFLNPLTVHESHEAELERDLTKAVKSNKLATSRNKKTQEPAKPKSKNLRISNRPKKAKEGYLTMDDLKSESSSDLDEMIAELYKDMEELKINREKLKIIEDQLEEEEAVDEALKKVASKTEEESISDISNDSTSEKGEELSDLKTEVKTDDSEEKSSNENDDKSENSEDNTFHHREKVPIKKASESRSARISPINKEVEISRSLTGGSRKSDINEDSDDEEDSQPKSENSPLEESKDTDETNALEVKSTTDSKDSSRKEIESDTEEEKKSKTEQHQIIDEFIKNNPSISPKSPDTKTTDQSDLSWNSNDLHPDIASEYLAEIYLEQGHKDRALQILEALIVRFPEKSFYFADIIKKINEKE